MLTHTSVYTAARPRTASRGSVCSVERAAAPPARQREVVLVQRVAGGRGHRHVHPGERAEHRQRAGDVVAVADVGRRAAPSSEPNASRSVSRSASAWQGWCRAVSMLMTGTSLCSASSASIASGPVRTPTAATCRESTAPCRAAPRRARAAARRAQHHRVAAQLVDAHLERHARARGGLLEDQRHAAPGERLRGQRRGLQLERAVQQRVQLGGAQLGAGEEMAWHGRPV